MRYLLCLLLGALGALAVLPHALRVGHHARVVARHVVLGRERVADRDDRGEERREDVELHNRPHLRARVLRLLRHRVHDEDEDEQRRHALERAHKEIAEDGNRRHRLRRENRDEDAEHQTHDDELDERRLLILLNKGNNSFRYIS